VFSIREDHEIITLTEFLESLDGMVRKEESTFEQLSLELLLAWLLSMSNKHKALLRFSLAREVWQLSWNSITLTSGMRAQNVIVLLVTRECRELWTQRGGVTPLCVVPLLKKTRNRDFQEYLLRTSTRISSDREKRG
jgi:hypothetical protein